MRGTIDVVVADAGELRQRSLAGRALEQWCATATTTHEQRICATFSPTWSTCPADIRAASRLRDHWINDETIVMRNLGGEWLGVVFRETDGAWTVVGTDGGDIP